MKTHAFKNSESVNITFYDVLFASIIVFTGILLFVANNRQSLMEDSSINSLSNTDFLKNETMKYPASEIEFSMTKIHEYLIPETEPELEVSDVSSIVFPDAEMVVLTANNTVNNDHFLKDLKIQASEKTRKAVEFYALEKKMKEYLTIETEQPLQLEKWMLNENYWFPKLRDAMPLKQEK